MLQASQRGRMTLLTSPVLEKETRVRFVFSGRTGGVGTGHFEGLNLSYNVGDDPSIVRENRSLLAEQLGVPLSRWVLCRQVHGTGVAVVGGLQEGRGATDRNSGIPRTDGLVTSSCGTAIGVLTADCVPLIIVEPVAPAVAVIHAGWRGVLSGIAAVGVGKLAKRSNGAPGTMYAFVGPHIGPCCMEVGEDVASLFAEAFGDGVLKGTEKSLVDLRAAVGQQLVGAGLPESHIFDGGLCTACSQDYFSFRGDPECGRQISLAWIEEGGS